MGIDLNEDLANKGITIASVGKVDTLAKCGEEKGGLGDGAVADAFDYSGRLTRKGIVDRKKMWGRVI